MKRKKPKRGASSTKSSPQTNAGHSTAKDGLDYKKRSSLAGAGKFMAITLVVGAASFFLHEAYQDFSAEGDLERVGNGKPSIVQIHDPNCPVCNALQKETRAALSKIDNSRLQYLVANIRTSKGREFANRHNVHHVTLLLFDEFGNLKTVLRGMQEEEALAKRFQEIAS